MLNRRKIFFRHKKCLIPIFSALNSSPSRHHLAQRGAMLEAMTRSASEQPNIFAPRMAVDDEVVVGAVFVLANAGLEQRRILQGGKAEGDIVPDGLEPLRADCSFP